MWQLSLLYLYIFLSNTHILFSTTDVPTSSQPGYKTVTARRVTPTIKPGGTLIQKRTRTHSVFTQGKKKINSVWLKFFLLTMCVLKESSKFLLTMCVCFKRKYMYFNF